MPKSKSTKSTLKKSPRAVKTSAHAVDTTWHARFLEGLGKSCNVTVAANVARIDRTTAYNHYKTQPDFAAAWDDAKEAAVEILEAEAWNRARKQSDLLLIFLLKAHKPGMYRETIRNEHSGIGGKPIEHRVSKFEEAADLIYGNDEKQTTD